MTKIICEICEGDQVIKMNGKYVCQKCGTQYTIEEAKKLLHEIDDSPTNATTLDSSNSEEKGKGSTGRKRRMLEGLTDGGINTKKSLIPIIIIATALIAIIVAYVNLYSIPNKKYNSAVQYMQNKKYTEAYNLFGEVSDFKDSKELRSSIKGDYEAETIKQAQVGDIVKYGKYEQDGNTENGKERIEWIILYMDSSKAKLLSRYGLDAKEYDTFYSDAEVFYSTWKDSTLRTWLKDSFYTEAFTKSEKKRILPETHEKDLPKETYEDKISLLEFSDVRVKSDGYLICKPTPYADEQGCYTYGADNEKCAWWIRTENMTVFTEKYKSNGVFKREAVGTYIDSTGKDQRAKRGMKAAVRPTIVVDLSDL